MMSVNIHIKNEAAPAAQSCLPIPTGTGDDLALYWKIGSALGTCAIPFTIPTTLTNYQKKAVALCTVLLSRFIYIACMILAIWDELVKARRAGAHNHISAITASTQVAAPAQEALAPGAVSQSDSLEEVEMSSALEELQDVTIAWLRQSMTAVMNVAMGMIWGNLPGAEGEDGLPFP